MYDQGLGHAHEPTHSASTPARLSRQWDALVRAASAIDDALPAPSRDGPELARIIAQYAPERAYYARIEQAFAQLVADLRDESEADAEAGRWRASELISALEPELLRAIIGASSDPAHRREVLDDAAAGLSVDALLRLVLASAAEAGLEMSPPLVRLLYKLAVQTRSGPPELRAHADAALRGQVKALVARWWLVQHNSMAFGFDDLYQSSFSEHGSAIEPEPDRMVHMALEIDAVGMPIWGPITHMLADDRFPELLVLLRRAPAGSRAARAIAGHVATPHRLSVLLSQSDVDFDSVDRFVDALGGGAAAPLLDRLASADSRAVRRGIFDRLVRLGTQVGPAAFERLSDKHWFVQRNLLALLGELRYWPEGKPVDVWIQHPDPRIRKEAVRSMLRMPKHCDYAILQSLRADSDRQTLRLVLAAARDRTPEAAVPLIVKRLNDDRIPPDLRAAAVRLLGNSRSALALEALIRLVEGGRSMLGKSKLAPKSADMLAALRALAAVWPREPRARALLERARGSKDPDVANAALGVGEPADVLSPEEEEPGA